MEYGKRVMVVDDNKIIRSALSHTLTSRDFDVTLCENGTEALFSLLSSEFDYIIIDYDMPGMDGLDLTKRLRKRALPLTVLIGMSGEDRSLNFLNAGAHDFLMKPFDLHDLAAMMDGSRILA